MLPSLHLHLRSLFQLVVTAFSLKYLHARVRFNRSPDLLNRAQPVQAARHVGEPSRCRGAVAHPARTRPSIPAQRPVQRTRWKPNRWRWSREMPADCRNHVIDWIKLLTDLWRLCIYFNCLFCSQLTHWPSRPPQGRLLLWARTRPWRASWAWGSWLDSP